jgi:two-component system, cell cycle sensor histidine kinase and response regulator CckA
MGIFSKITPNEKTIDDMRKRANFTKLIKSWGLIFLLGIGASIVAIDVLGSIHDFNARVEKMRSDYIVRQKNMIRQEVNRVVDLITYEKAQGNILAKHEIKSRVIDAYSIAENLYRQNRNEKTDNEIKKWILDALRPLRFESGNGFYSIIGLDGVGVLFPDRPRMEGLNLLNLRDAHGQSAIKDIIEIASISGEGFYEYHRTKPGSSGNDFKKISFIKLFEPYGWIIGTGFYSADVEKQIKGHLLPAISRIRFGKEGYIFINRLNGDALVSNGELFPETKKLWEVFDKNPEEMKGIFKKEYAAALKPDGDYIYYSHIKLSAPEKESPKVSFIQGIPDLQWLVGAGVYLDDVEADIATLRSELNHQIKVRTLLFALIVAGIIALFILFFNGLNRALIKDFNLFLSFFKTAANSDVEMDRNTIRFKELDQIAENANKMLSRRKQAEEAVKTAHERFLKVLNSIDATVYVADMQTYEILFMNQHMAESFGQDMTGEICWKVFRGSPGPCPNCTNDRLIDEKGRPAGVIIWQDRNPITGKWYNNYDRAIEWTDGRLVRLQIAADITELKTMEAKLRQAQRMESIGNLAGGIAHDFNNILSSILGFTELALDDVDKGTPLEENLQEIYTAGKRARDLVKQILAFARQSDEERKPVRVDTILMEALKLVRSTTPTSIEINQKISSNSSIMGNATQVHQLILNLCTNAVRAMEKTGGVMGVELTDVELDADSPLTQSGLNPGSYLNLTVSDTGIGIGPDIIGSIFEPYFTTSKVGKGTGMGLALVHGIVETYGGKITVDSEVGKGTVFSIYLPITKKHNDNQPYVEEDLPSGNERILLVDDELPIAKMGGRILELLGYRVTVRTSSIEALELFRAKPADFDLVVTDMTMPNMTGDELAIELLEIRPDIPVILCTGYSKNITDETASEIGIKAFAYKPIVKSDLAKIVRKVLDAGRSGT